MKKIEGYTNGPWAVLDTAGETIIADRPGEGMFSIASTKNHSAIGDQQRANAELIANAPETYERCVALEAMMKEMIELVDRRWGYPNDASSRQDILSRAEKLMEEK